MSEGQSKLAPALFKFFENGFFFFSLFILFSVLAGKGPRSLLPILRFLIFFYFLFSKMGRRETTQSLGEGNKLIFSSFPRSRCLLSFFLSSYKTLQHTSSCTYVKTETHLVIVRFTLHTSFLLASSINQPATLPPHPQPLQAS